MNLALILGCLWNRASAFVALMLTFHQHMPSVMPLAATPLLLAWIAGLHGAGIIAFGLFAFLSTFRNPSIDFWRRAKGERAEVPR